LTGWSWRRAGGLPGHRPRAALSALPLQTPQRAAPQLPVHVGAQEIMPVLVGTSRIYQRPGGPE
jgi:hypothetical protein